MGDIVRLVGDTVRLPRIYTKIRIATVGKSGPDCFQPRVNRIELPPSSIGYKARNHLQRPRQVAMIGRRESNAEGCAFQGRCTAFRSHERRQQIASRENVDILTRTAPIWNRQETGRRLPWARCPCSPRKGNWLDLRSCLRYTTSAFTTPFVSLHMGTDRRRGLTGSTLAQPPRCATRHTLALEDATKPQCSNGIRRRDGWPRD